jgi:hypothetical protein
MYILCLPDIITKHPTPTSTGLWKHDAITRKLHVSMKIIGKIKLTLIGRLASGCLIRKYSRPEIDIRMKRASTKLT